MNNGNGPMVVSGFTGRMAQAIVEQPVRLQRLDRVKIGNGSVLIVTGYRPNAPVNCYTGVLENGQGKEYVFGPKHRPVKLGVVNEGHPALLNNKTRAASKQGMDGGTMAMVRQMVEAVEGDDLDSAKVLARTLRGVIGG